MIGLLVGFLLSGGPGGPGGLAEEKLAHARRPACVREYINKRGGRQAAQAPHRILAPIRSFRSQGEFEFICLCHIRAAAAGADDDDDASASAR